MLEAIYSNKLAKIYNINESLFQTEIISEVFLFLIKNRIKFVNSGSEIGRISSEGNLEHVQELIHSFKKSLWGISDTFHSRLSLIHDNLICQVSWHNKIVFNNGCTLLIVDDESLDNFGCNDSLLGIQICWGLINQISISTLGQSKNDSNSLKLSAWKLLDLIVDNVVQFHRFCNFWNKGGSLPGLTAF